MATHQGARGKQGIQGKRGVRGQQGLRGKTGKTGPTGPAGPTMKGAEILAIVKEQYFEDRFAEVQKQLDEIQAALKKLTQ